MKHTITFLIILMITVSQNCFGQQERQKEEFEFQHKAKRINTSQFFSKTIAPTNNILFYAENFDLVTGETTFLNWEIYNASDEFKRVTLKYSLDSVNFNIVSDAFAVKGKHFISPKQATFYRLSFGNLERTLKINVRSLDKANQELQFFANKNTIQKGDSVKLSWKGSNIPKILLSSSTDGINFNQIDSKDFSFVTDEFYVKPDKTTYYRIKADDKASFEKIIKVDVETPKSSSIEYFYFEKDEVKEGDSTKLIWSILRADNVILETSKNGINWTIEENTIYANKGEKNISPLKDVYYRLIAGDATITLKLKVIK